MIRIQEKFRAKSLQPLKESPQGFTFPEVVIVMMAWSVLSLTIISINHRTLDTIQSTDIIGQLHDDVLLTQQLTMQEHPYYQIMFRQSQNHYLVYDYKNKKMLCKRILPDNWRIEMLTLPATVRFNSKGLITKPGTMKIHSPSHAYKITFPFGASRITIEKQ